ncbi:HNH endonuclease [Arthrobacter monumenti]
MFGNSATEATETSVRANAADGGSPWAAPITAPDSIAVWIEELRHLEVASKKECIDSIGALEDLKAAAAAAQARFAADFDSRQRQDQAAMGMPKKEQGKGIAGEIALARRVSPHQGNQHLGFSKALVNEMPHTLKALTAGKVSEWRATLLVKETACLTVEDRAEVDHQIASDQDYLQGLSDRRLAAEARKVSYKLDPHSVVRRAAKATNERSVTGRPAPDAMAYVTALLPASQGVAVLAALTRAANGPRAEGDQRGRGQFMADTFVERITGQWQADAPAVDVQVVMTDRTLLAGDGEPAFLPGYGVIPAQTGRDLARQGTAAAEAWIRRLYTAPVSGQLIGMDSRSRLFPKGLARFIATRDQICGTPWCDAPIRHTDHVVPWSAGGQTNETNGRGLCEACNYAKEAPGWAVQAAPDPPDTGPDRGSRYRTKTSTPTGHVYWSTAPSLPGATPAKA